MTVRSRLPKTEAVMLSVSDGTTTVGFVLRRADGFEAFNRAGKSIGKFQSQQEATRAIPRRAKESGP
jgi:hypothetical protein